MENKQYIQEDEIDLKELFIIIWKRKLFIILLTSFVTLIAIIYVLIKNPIPIYQGKAFLEIGKIQSQTFGQILLDNPADLAEILNIEYKVEYSDLSGTLNIEHKVESSVVKLTTSLLEIISKNENKEEIQNNIKDAVAFLINKHSEKAKFYENVIMSKQIGNIIIDDNPINKPKKPLIVVVSFVSGFILSIFLVFFIEFVKNFNRKEDSCK